MPNPSFTEGPPNGRHPLLTHPQNSGCLVFGVLHVNHMYFCNKKGKKEEGQRVERRLLVRNALTNNIDTRKVDGSGTGTLATRNPTSMLSFEGVSSLRKDAARMLELKIHEPPRSPRDEPMTASFHSRTLPA